MSWMGTGWGSMDTAWDNVPKKGGDGPRRVWMPPETTQRHLFLDDDPQTLWEHKYKWSGEWNNYEPCVVRNKLGPECPPCEAYPDRYPHFIGLHTTINMTPWFTKKHNTEINYQREIFAAKMGGKDKPGVLQKLRKLCEKHGRLRGLIFDVERPGKKTESCGSEFELVEKIELNQIGAYKKDLLSDYLKRRNKDVPDDKQMTMEKWLKWNDWEPYDFEEIYKPKPIEVLKTMFAGGGGATMEDSDSSDQSGGGYDADDEIPY